MTEQGRTVEIEKCPHCGNHIGFYANEDSLLHSCHVFVDGKGVICAACNTLLLPADQIPCAVLTKSPDDGEIEG